MLITTSHNTAHKQELPTGGVLQAILTATYFQVRQVEFPFYTTAVFHNHCKLILDPVRCLVQAGIVYVILTLIFFFVKLPIFYRGNRDSKKLSNLLDNDFECS